MNERVTVTVDGRESTFFLGLSVRHAIGARAARSVEKGLAEVLNDDGNRVDLGGALFNGEKLFVHLLVAPRKATPRSSKQAAKRTR